MKQDREHMHRVLEAALRYAKRGWPVLPLHAVVNGQCTCGKADCSSPGKHPTNENGVSGATTDEAQIRQWFDGSRPRNLGVACGERSGLFVLDFDAPEGEQWFEAITGDTLSSFATLKARTGLKQSPGFSFRGGHLFFKWTPQLAQLKNAAKDIPGVDWRTTGGYIVVAPSLHASGVDYEWAGDGEEAEVASIPPSLLGAILEAVKDRREPTLSAASNWSIGEGRRNGTLYRIGCGMRGRGEELEAILDELIRVNRTRCRPLLSEQEVEQTAKNACKHPKGSDDPSAIGQAGSMTDLWMARQFLRDWEGLVHWIPELGRWIYWSEADGVWRQDQVGQINQWFRETVSRIVRHFAQKVGGNNELVKILKRISSYNNAKPEQAALTMALSEPGVSISVLCLDARPELLACGNCTLELEAGRSRPNDPADLLTTATAVKYDPDAQCPTFDRFIEWAFPDAEVREYFRGALGASLLGRVRGHYLHIAHGSGGNGKSTIFSVVGEILGGHFGQVAPGVLLRCNSEQHPTAIADLKGRRLVVATESGERDQLDEEQVKRLTGGDPLKARVMRGDFFQFQPSHHLWLQCNHLPKLEDCGDAMRRRVRVIPFLSKVNSNQVDEDLPGKLVAEGSGILNWLLVGLQASLGGSLKRPPEGVSLCSREYLREGDPLGRFLEDYTKVSPKGAKAPPIPLESFTEQYQAFCAEELLPATTVPTTRGFKKDLESRGVIVNRGAQGQLVIRGLEFSPPSIT